MVGTVNALNGPSSKKMARILPDQIVMYGKCTGGRAILNDIHGFVGDPFIVNLWMVLETLGKQRKPTCPG